MGYSRIVLLAREGVRLSILDDCMDGNIPSIWVKITSKGRKPLVIGGLYREFHHLLQPSPNNTDDWALQIARWKTTIASWKRASLNSKCIVVGDLNIDFLQWHLPTYRLKKLAQLIQDEIVTLGFCQLIKSITRSWPGQPSSILDHILTNLPGNIMSTANTVRSSSDHNVISLIIRTRDRKEQCQEVLRRDRSKINVERYIMKIKNIDWKELFESTDINIINSVFETKVGAILEEEAPLKSYQHRSNFKSWLTPELKLQMEIRDTKRELARQTNDKKHWKEYRVERNKCSKNLHKVDREFHNKLYRKFEETHDVKSIYKTTRRLLNWKGGGGPQSFLKNGLLVRRPIELANLQMEFFNDKVKGLIRDLPITNTNPLKWIKKSMESWKAEKVGSKLPIFKFKELTLLENCHPDWRSWKFNFLRNRSY